MRAFEEKDYRVFELFNKQWGLVTAGDGESYNTCTIAWGSMGTIWGAPGKGRPILTVYVHPDRFTHGFLQKSDSFTVSFFPEEYRDALLYLGSHSGRDGDKIAAAGLTPQKLENGVGFEEARLTFVCRKLYQGQFRREGLADEIGKGYYAKKEPHWMFVGEILSVQE